MLFHEDKVPVHTFMIGVAKLNELRYQLLHCDSYSSDTALNDYYLLFNLIRWLPGKKFASNKDLECENDVYFITLDKSYYTKLI